MYEILRDWTIPFLSCTICFLLGYYKCYRSHKQDKTRLINTIKSLVDVNFAVPAEMDGDPMCFWCGEWLGGLDPHHDDDCLYIEAMNVLGRYGANNGVKPTFKGAGENCQLN